MSEEFFPDIGTIAYEGPDSDDPLAFRWYDADRIVAGRRMEDHLRFAVCYWHTFAWDGFDIFGAGTLDRPWHPTQAPARDPLEAAQHKMDAAFEFFAKLGTPFFCFHDVDIAPPGDSFAESCRNLDMMIDEAAAHMERTGVNLLWGTANLFSPPPLPGRRGDQSRPRRVRLRRGSSRSLHDRDTPPRRSELSVVGWPRRLRNAAQHRHAPRA